MLWTSISATAANELGHHLMKFQQHYTPLSLIILELSLSLMRWMNARFPMEVADDFLQNYSVFKLGLEPIFSPRHGSSQRLRGSLQEEVQNWKSVPVTMICRHIYMDRC